MTEAPIGGKYKGSRRDRAVISEEHVLVDMAIANLVLDITPENVSQSIQVTLSDDSPSATRRFSPPCGAVGNRNRLVTSHADRFLHQALHRCSLSLVRGFSRSDRRCTAE